MPVVSNASSTPGARSPQPEYFLRKSIRHAKQLLPKLNDNDDRALLAAGDAIGQVAFARWSKRTSFSRKRSALAPVLA